MGGCIPKSVEELKAAVLGHSFPVLKQPNNIMEWQITIVVHGVLPITKAYCNQIVDLMKYETILKF